MARPSVSRPRRLGRNGCGPTTASPPDHLATVLCRKVAPACLVTLETNRDAVPPAYVGRTVEVHWRHEGAIQIYHQGTRIATHPRAHGQHQVCVDPIHSQALRPRLSRPGTAPDRPSALAPTSWTGPFPDVEVRPLAQYEALMHREVGHA
jgi:hypothetical protein